MKKIFFVLLISFIGACDRKQALPSEILPQEKMVSLFIDMHIAESKLLALNLKRDSSKLLFKDYEKEILKKHNVSEDRYLKSYLYYIENVNDMEKIYDAVIDSLSLRERILQLE